MKNEWQPNLTLHPGKYVNEYTKLSWLSKEEIADRLLLEPDELDLLVSGKVQITPGLASLLEGIFGLRAPVWLGLQEAWGHLERRRVKECNRPDPPEDGKGTVPVMRDEE